MFGEDTWEDGALFVCLFLLAPVWPLTLAEADLGDLSLHQPHATWLGGGSGGVMLCLELMGGEYDCSSSLRAINGRVAEREH